ncbi:hypothetical protein [Pseudoalteromonas luteoviolacea]|nr:hypothetical protein [Pseudoalteromonas luteoviolacea]
MQINESLAGFSSCDRCASYDCECEESTYTICAEVTRVVHINVEASSKEKAVELAKIEIANDGFCEEKELVAEPKINWVEGQQN